MPTSHLRLFAPDASILLLGFDGAGRKTLGIIASIVEKRQFVEYGRFFANSTGHSLKDYVTLYGVQRYNEVVPQVIEELLSKHNLNCVISGIPQSCIRSQKDILKSFSATNPVIYIRRIKHELEMFTRNESEKAERVYDVLDRLYNACSNLDYFNLSQSLDRPNLDYQSQPGLRSINTLKLKAVETDWIRFIHRIFGRQPYQPLTRHPLSGSYSYALQVSLQWLESNPDYQDLECGADVISLIVNTSEVSQGLHDRLVQQMAIIRRKTKLPVILHTENLGNNNMYLPVVNLGLRTLPDAVTIDLTKEHEQIVLFNKVKGYVKMIGTYRHTGGWNDFLGSRCLPNLLDKAGHLDLKALEICVQSCGREETLDCLDFLHSMHRISKIPIIAYNAGNLGRTSICFNKNLSPVVLESFRGVGVTIKQARLALYSTFVLEPLKFSIIGSSVSYSLSPAMHNAAYDVCGMQNTYDYYQTYNFGDVKDLLYESNRGGVAISMPYKTQILSYLDIVSPEARQIGAVNTVVVDRKCSESIVLKGYNTDYIGIKECIRKNLSPANSIHTSSTALIIGAGGMARAAIYALKMLGVKVICVYNRTFENATKLSQHLSDVDLRILPSLDADWPTRLEQPTIIVSTIPAHRIEDTPAHEINIPKNWLGSTSGGTFLELAYKPLETRLIRQIRQISDYGWIAVDGLNVLLEQGIAQFELFTGSPAPVSIMENALRNQFAVARAADSESESD